MSKYNYFNEVLVDGYSFPATPQVDFGFTSQGFGFINRGTYVIEYSFNGVDLHGDLDPSDSSYAPMFDNRFESKVFFRAVGGFSTVRVEAWGRF